ncbi:MAG: glycoside hydrolase family 5 protein [Ginsengibacter sp.]
MKKRTGLLWIILCVLLNSIVAAPVKTIDIFSANKMLAKTINLGYTFDAPKEGDWGNRINESELLNIKSAGFTAIRLPIQWVARMDSTAPYTIDKSFRDRIDWVIKQALKNELAIVIENCLDEQLMAQPDKYKDRFLSLWKQVSIAYSSYPQQVMFEIMAEPHGELTKFWEKYYTEALGIIRKNNPVRPVIIGAIFYNSPQNLSGLHLPENDQYIIGTFHMYQPIKFTMQGEQWLPFGKPMEWIGTKWTGTADERNVIISAMDLAGTWAVTHKRPVFMGEFGASDHADIDSRAKLLKFYREQAEQRHFSWGVWSYNIGFSIYDNQSGQWRRELLDALIPAAIRAPADTSAYKHTAPLKKSIPSGIPAEILNKAVAVVSNSGCHFLFNSCNSCTKIRAATFSSIRVIRAPKFVLSLPLQFV